MSAFLSPSEVAQAVVQMGKKKASLPIITMLFLALLAGAYIAIGAQLATVVTHDLAKYSGIGFAKFMGGAVFSVGLMLVIIGGAELFTGNNLITMAVLSKEVSWGQKFRNWTIVYLGNFLGALLVVFIMYQTGLWAMGESAVGAKALAIANAKVNLTFSQAFYRGIMCNWLVCLAVWLAIAGKDIVSKIFAIFFPIMAFVASGFEHSVANMYFVPIGIALKNQSAVVGTSGLAGELGNLNWGTFIWANLLPVTLGNIVGGAVFVGTIYWFIYLRNNK